MDQVNGIGVRIGGRNAEDGTVTLSFSVRRESGAYSATAELHRLAILPDGTRVEDATDEALVNMAALSSWAWSSAQRTGSYRSGPP